MSGPAVVAPGTAISLAPVERPPSLAVVPAKDAGAQPTRLIERDELAESHSAPRFQFVADRGGALQPLAPIERKSAAPVILSFDGLQKAEPLSKVTSPRKERESEKLIRLAPNTAAQPSTDWTSPQQPSKPGWDDPRLRRLPPVFESAKQSLQNVRELPQQPIPDYPDATDRGGRAATSEDL
jgi:hypothetical protein